MPSWLRAGAVFSPSHGADQLGDDAETVVPDVRGRVPVVRQPAHGRRQSPTAAPGPGVVVVPERRAEQLPRLGLEEVPRGEQVDGWVAETQAAEVDDGRQPAVLHQEVAGLDVAV